MEIQEKLKTTQRAGAEQERINRQNQKDNNFYIEKSTIVVYNNGNEDIRAQIEALISKF